MKTAYRLRIYPNEEQRTILKYTFGCVRYVTNYFLALRVKKYREEGVRLSYEDTSALLTQLKKEPGKEWLKEVSSVPIQQSLRHLDRAFKNFFEGRARHPKFKKRHSGDSAEYTSSAFTFECIPVQRGKRIWNKKTLRLSRMPGYIEVVWSRPMPPDLKPTTITISRDSAGRYFASFFLEVEKEQFAPNGREVGIDLGVNSLIVTSDGVTYGNKRFFERGQAKLRREQRRLSRKEKGSRNREKARQKVARAHVRIADKRSDYQHQVTTELVRKYEVIYAEGLNVKGMAQNPTLAKAIHDVAWGGIIHKLKYKSEWHGRVFKQIGTFYPSSKTCSVCGHLLIDLPLDVRRWTCPQCGMIHNRDLNAAINVLQEGRRLRTEEATKPATAEEVRKPPTRKATLTSREPKPRKPTVKGKTLVATK